MTQKEAAHIIKEHNRKDNVYTTHTDSSENFSNFLKQCKRAVNKMQGIPDAKVDEEFFSGRATEQANRFYDRKIKDRGLFGNSPLSVERWKEHDAIEKMSNWEYLRKYGELHIQDGWFCVDFEFGGIVFAGLSQQALVEMGVFTKDDCKLFLDAIEVIDYGL